MTYNFREGLRQKAFLQQILALLLWMTIIHARQKSPINQGSMHVTRYNRRMDLFDDPPVPRAAPLVISVSELNQIGRAHV